MENHHAIKNGKPSIDGPFSMAMLNNQRIYTRMPEKKEKGMRRSEGVEWTLLARSTRYQENV